LIAVYAGLCVAHGNTSAFMTVLNDFWGNAFAADYWEWNASRVWNGFFPPGYPFLLTVLPGRRLIESAYYFNVLAGILLLAGIFTTLKRLQGVPPALVAIVLVALHPMVLTQVLTTGPDAAFVTCAVIGALLLFAAATSERASARSALLAGCLLAAAGWLRYHAFLWSGAVLVAAVLVGGPFRLRQVATVAVPILLSGLGLVALGLAAGDLLLVQRDQAFNVYTRLLEAPNWNWFHLPTSDVLPKTIGEAIARNPEAFWRNYVAFSAPHVWLLFLPAVAIAVGTGRARRFGAFVFISSILFVPVVNLGASPRGVASVVPLTLIAGAWAITDVLTRLRNRTLRVLVAAVVAVLVVIHVARVWAPEIREYVRAARFRADVSSSLEATLRADRVRFAAQVFSTADLYFLGASGWQVRNYHPRIIGGWPTVDLAGYFEVFPALSTTSLDDLLNDCQRFGITHLVLGAASSLAQQELGSIYDGSLTSARLVELPGLAGVRVFRIVS
jgi:hypothetical protein